MIFLRHMLSCEQNSWVTRQVTRTWIQLPEGDSDPANVGRVATAASNSKVEHLSTLATNALAKVRPPAFKKLTNYPL